MVCNSLKNIVWQGYCRGRHGGGEKRGGRQRGFEPPLVRYVFHLPRVSLLCFSCTKIHDWADQKLFWRGPEFFFVPPMRFAPHVMRQGYCYTYGTIRGLRGSNRILVRSGSKIWGTDKYSCNSFRKPLQLRWEPPYTGVSTPPTEPRNPRKVSKRCSRPSRPGVSKKCWKSPRTLFL